MKHLRIGSWIALGLLLSAAPAARAQRGKSGMSHGAHGTYQRPLFPPLLDPFWATPQALLNRDTAFRNGQVYGPNSGYGNSGHYGYGYGYPGYSFPGYYSQPYGYYSAPFDYSSSYGSYGSYPYGPAYQQPPVVIINEPILSPPNMGSGGTETGTSRERQRPSGDDFYLKGRSEGENLSEALDDIRKAWLNGDFDRIKARFAAEGKIRIYPGGQYRYSIDVKEFTQLLKDAMTRLDTTAFEFDRPVSEQAGRAFVTGKHTFLDADKKKQQTYISYLLERIDGKWKITQAGSSTSPIPGHEE